jgi:hypothetical protein
VAAAPLGPDDLAALQAALARLERGRGLVVRMADLVGGAARAAGRFGLDRLGLSGLVPTRLNGVAEAALSRAYDVAILRLDERSPERATAFARVAVVVSGAMSGFVGLPGFLPDAMFTTLAIMREIARAAQIQGEDLSSEDARRACLEVFALRAEGETTDDDFGYSARLAFQGQTFTRLVGEVASRYGFVLGEKFSLQAVPIAGAVAGASLNSAFLEHYRSLAEAHFTIRRLERVYGRDVVQAAAGTHQNHGADVSFSAA